MIASGTFEEGESYDLEYLEKLFPFAMALTETRKRIFADDTAAIYIFVLETGYSRTYQLEEIVKR